MSSNITVKPALRGAALREALREVMGQCLDLDRFEIFIFGSEATGTGTERSDIDIGILGKEHVSAAIMRKIREQLETLRTLRVFDVVDFTTVDQSFKSVALRNVERL